jgi:hypothetical protein
VPFKHLRAFKDEALLGQTKLCHSTAIHSVYLTSDKCAFLSSKKCNKRGDIFRFASAVHWVNTPDILAKGIWVWHAGDKVVVKFSLYPPRRNGITSNAFSPVINRNSARQPMQTGL